MTLHKEQVEQQDDAEEQEPEQLHRPHLHSSLQQLQHKHGHINGKEVRTRLRNEPASGWCNGSTSQGLMISCSSSFHTRLAPGMKPNPL